MVTRSKPNHINGINLTVLNETVALVQKDPGLGKCKFRARNKWIDADHNSTTVSGFYAAKQELTHKKVFELHSDEPPMLAGEDQAANPVEHLLHALASCLTTGIVAHAAVKGIPIEELESELEGDIDLNGFLGLNPEVPKGFTNIRVKFRIKTDPKNLKMLKRLCEFSPVYHTITEGTKVDIEVASK